MDQIILTEFNKIRYAPFHPSQMQRYMDKLYVYATKCDHITEMGVAVVCSTWAFLAANPKRLVSIDIDPNCPVQPIREAAERIGVDFEFVVGDTNHGVTKNLNPENPYSSKGVHDQGDDIPYYDCEPTDLLFLDTYHHHDGLKREFELHADKSRKYIILHDTVSFGTKGEGNDTKGLQPAINEFLANNTQWIKDWEDLEWPGLIILKRADLVE
jgi:hypothetical protein